MAFPLLKIDIAHREGGENFIRNIDGLVKSLLGRHPGESRGPDAVPAKAGNQKYMNLDSCFHRKPWIPAFAGMTNSMEFRLFTKTSTLIHQELI
jgi:hypothetical protein